MQRELGIISDTLSFELCTFFELGFNTRKLNHHQNVCLGGVTPDCFSECMYMYISHLLLLEWSVCPMLLHAGCNNVVYRMNVIMNFR